MRKCLITFRSVTPAQKAERILKSAGLNSVIVRTPKWMEEQGCGYSLQVYQKQLQHCVDILRRNRIPYRKVYLSTDNGTMEAIEI